VSSFTSHIDHVFFRIIVRPVAKAHYFI